MTLLAIGINHKTAPVALREKLAFSESELPAALRSFLSSTDDITEAVIVSTCNRTEVYVSALTAPLGVDAVCTFLEEYQELSYDEYIDLGKCIYIKQGESMVSHLFRVVTSLDSLVLGEAQIIGQIRRAYLTASAAHVTGELFNHLFREALELGKRARSETAIGQESVSVSTVAVSLAESIFTSLRDKRLLVLGAGEMAELTLNYLIEKGIGDIVVANRTLEHARTLAGASGARAVGLDHLEDELSRTDIVISSTGSSEFIITEDMMGRVASRRSDNPLLLIDIALPRDIDPACDSIDGVFRYDLDDMSAIIDEHMQEREQEAAKVEELVTYETNDFLRWLQEREVTPTIKEMYGKGDNVCDREVAHACKELAKTQGFDVTDEQAKVLKALAGAVEKKILHGPAVRLRKQAGNPSAYLYTESVRFLFGLDNNPLGLPCKHDLGQRCRLDKGEICTLAKNNMCPHGRSIV